MSVSAIQNSAYSPYQLGSTGSLAQQQMQQLSQDLQSGNLTAAQSDFSALQQAFSQPPTTTSAPSTPSTSNPLAQAFNQLGSDLQSGNSTAAQKDVSTLKQDFQSQGTLAGNHFHAHRLGGGGGGGSSSSTGQSALLQELNSLGQSLTANNLSAAQQTYATVQQQLQQFALGGSLSSSQTSALLAQSPVSLMA
jgi:hypothetical protein